MSIRHLLIALLLLTAACNDDVQGPTQPAADADAYAVYSAVIDSLYIVENIDYVVIRVMTDPYPLGDTATVSHIRQKIAVPDALFDSYALANTASFPLERKFTIATDYALVQDSSVQRIWTEGGWEKFYTLYPNAQGYMTLSRVGFSADGNTALVYVSNMPMFLAGHGVCVRCERQNGVWKVTGDVVVWIS